MDKLANGDSVVMIGNVQRSYNGLSYNVKTIALCEIPDNIYELLEQQKVEVEEKFMFVTPEKIENVTQEDLFSQGPMYKKHILENEFVVFDVETTGLDADTCEIIEIGACKIRKGIITEKFQTLIKPKRPISELITNLTGIDNSMVASCHTIEDIIKDFHYFCKNAILVGYNVNFDIKFIQNSAKLVGMSFDNAVEDAMTLAREKLRLSNYKLGTVVKALDIKLLNAHRAYNDALATAKAFLKLSEI